MTRRVGEGAAATAVGEAQPTTARWLRRVVILALVAIPVLLLAAGVLTWLGVAIDIPVADDWRPYLDREADSLDLAYLFKPQNDTIYPIGRLLDVLALHAIGGNSVIYQSITMVTVLGSLLALQWVLLRMAFRDALHTAVVFSLCSFMLIKGSYWGGPNMAYHQALPLLAVLAALVIALRPGASSWWGPSAAFALGIFAGLSYVSGAFAALVAGGTMMVVGVVGNQPSRRPVSLVGAGLALAGVVTVVVQLWAVQSFQDEGSMAGNPFTYPWQPDFWYYLGGKIGASLGLPADRLRVAILGTALAVAAGVVAVGWSLAGLRRTRTQPPRPDVVSVVTLTLAATILVYLMLIAAGRSSLRPAEGPATPVEVFQFGFFRFHFFWATIIWPWVGAVGLSVLLALTATTPRFRRTAVAVSVATVLAALLLVARYGKFDFTEFYDRWAGARLADYTCLLESRQRADGMECLIGAPIDPAGLIVYADSVGASFVRYLQPVPVPPPVEAMFSLADPSSGEVEFVDAELLEDDGSRLTIAAGDDAQLLITVADAEAMQQCLTLEVSAEIRPSEADVAQVFYMAPGDSRFSARQVATAPIAPDPEDWSTVSLLFSSDTGFAEVLRFDPVFNPQEFDLTDLELRCRWSAG